MATYASSAPLLERGALVEDPQSQELVQISRGLIEKILLAIPDTHESCVRSKALELNSSENAKLAIMVGTIGIPPAPVLRAVSDNFTLETCLGRISEGLQLHQALLSSVSPHLESKDKVAELLADIRDLVIHINKVLKTVQGDDAVQPTSTPVNLRLPGDFEVQVATHMTLVQLQSFSQDVVRCLRSLDQSNDEETES